MDFVVQPLGSRGRKRVKKCLCQQSKPARQHKLLILREENEINHLISLDTDTTVLHFHIFFACTIPAMLFKYSLCVSSPHLFVGFLKIEEKKLHVEFQYLEKITH